ncbi:phosphoglycerate mutase family protein [Striga asiatica]|uniref:Phosphoglycerate mutase family protein n=1 Tax=Striga asiatica TaxID=4170 RepID=A0A5A7QMT1_STRAF|nr:phosphoglycerate mutase family protein [Striga asiatica]
MYLLVNSWVSIVPTARLSLQIGDSMYTGILFSKAGFARTISFLSRAFSSDWHSFKITSSGVTPQSSICLYSSEAFPAKPNYVLTPHLLENLISSLDVAAPSVHRDQGIGNAYIGVHARFYQTGVYLLAFTDGPDTRDPTQEARKLNNRIYGRKTQFHCMAVNLFTEFQIRKIPARFQQATESIMIRLDFTIGYHPTVQLKSFIVMASTLNITRDDYIPRHEAVVLHSPKNHEPDGGEFPIRTRPNRGREANLIRPLPELQHLEEHRNRLRISVAFLIARNHGAPRGRVAAFGVEADERVEDGRVELETRFGKLRVDGPAHFQVSGVDAGSEEVVVTGEVRAGAGAGAGAGDGHEVEGGEGLAEAACVGMADRPAPERLESGDAGIVGPSGEIFAAGVRVGFDGRRSGGEW